MIKHLRLLKELPGVSVGKIVCQDCSTGEITTDSNNPFLLELIKSYKDGKYINWFRDEQFFEYELSDFEKLFTESQITELKTIINEKLIDFNINDFWAKQFYPEVKNDIEKYTDFKGFGIKLLEFILLSFVKDGLLINKGKLGKGKFRKIKS